MLEKLRAGKDILLTMLDAFVYDPLVDWAAAQDDLGSKSTIGIATIIAVYGLKFFIFLINLHLSFLNVTLK